MQEATANAPAAAGVETNASDTSAPLNPGVNEPQLATNAQAAASAAASVAEANAQVTDAWLPLPLPLPLPLTLTLTLTNAQVTDANAQVMANTMAEQASNATR